METFESTTEGTWKKIVPVALSKEQQELLISTKEEDRDARKILSDEIRSQREKAVTAKEKNRLDAEYNSLKSVLTEGAVYKLISIHLSEKEDKTFTGILNYRLNGEHKQERI
jgi:hypothetical protein